MTGDRIEDRPTGFAEGDFIAPVEKGPLGRDRRRGFRAQTAQRGVHAGNAGLTCLSPWTADGEWNRPFDVEPIRESGGAIIGDDPP